MVPKSKVSVLRRCLRRFVALPFALWMGLAIALRLPGPRFLALGLGVLLPLVALVLVFALPPWKGFACFTVGFLAILGGFLSVRPSNDRDWMPDVARVASAEVQGDRLLVHNVRQCVYRTETDYEARFEDRTYDLSRLRGMDLFVVSWGPRHIAHTILSFDFGGGEHLAFSIETRKERTEAFSTIKGFFREYELCVIAGDERDLVYLRTNLRGEQVRLYALNSPPATARAVLGDYLARINGLALRPEWYNALTDNCTTALVGPIRHHSARLPWSWKLVASGHLDELLYDRGILSHALPFAQARQAALINPRALQGGPDPAFSERIRAGLPGR